MSALTESIDRLEKFLQKQGIDWCYETVGIVELNGVVDLDKDGLIRISRNDVRTVVDYEGRFDSLMTAQLPWVKMSCLGMLDGTLLVSIEPASSRSGKPSSTSLNLSGPVVSVIRAKGSAKSILALM